METTRDAMREVPADGGTGPATDELVGKLKEEIRRIARHDSDTLLEQGLEARETRLAYWAGQAPDGLKHEAYLGSKPRPFEGATDTRVRLADMLTNEDVMLAVLAVLRARPVLKGVDGKAGDRKRALAATTVLRWIIRNQLGLAWVEQNVLLAQYAYGDQPGVALGHVWWREEEALRLEEVTVERLQGLYLERLGEELQARAEGMEPGEAEGLVEQARAAVQAFGLALRDPEYPAEELAGALLEFFPGVTEGRARKVVRELRRKGSAEFPVRYTAFRGIGFKALRWGEDWWCPLSTREFERCWCWFRPEWLHEHELRERVTSLGYSTTFVDEVLKHEGKPAFRELVGRAEDGKPREYTEEERRGLYQVVTCFFQASNEDGIPGKYFVTIHMDVGKAAHERRLLPYKHGKWPGHVLRREARTAQLLDSRGWPELMGPSQGFLKMLNDTWGDSAQLSGVPPVLTARRRGQGALRIRPLQELEIEREGTIRWMDPPKYPVTVDRMSAEARRWVNEYAGRAGEGVDPQLVQLHREFKTQWHLAQVRELVRQIWSLAQQYMTDEELARIVGPDGEPLVRSVEEIQGEFDAELGFDSRDFDPEYLSQVAKIVKDMLMAMDRRQTLDPTPIVAGLLARLLPDLAEEAIRPVEVAQANEQEEELKALTQMRAGAEPELPDDGSVDYETRLGLYEMLNQANPQWAGDLAEDKAAIVGSRLERLKALAEQFGVNRAIGRQGGKTAEQERKG